ncbi:Mercuric resistance operon regulatory protein [compost metagenome]
MGFSLDEVGALLTLDTACACSDTRALAVRKLRLIEQKMADLSAMHQALGNLVQQCDAGDGGAACPIIDVLERD